MKIEPRRDLSQLPHYQLALIEAAWHSPMSMQLIEKKAGVYARFLSTIGKPHKCRTPNLESIIAVGQVLGLELTWRPINQVLWNGRAGQLHKPLAEHDDDH